MPTQYRKREDRVEAYRLTETSLDEQDTWPQWLTDSWNLDRGAIGSINQLADSRFYLKLELFVVIPFGHWIVRDNFEELSVWSNFKFNLAFEEIT